MRALQTSLLVWLLWMGGVGGETNPQPPVFSLDFAEADTQGQQVLLTGATDWIRDIHQAGGSFNKQDGAWVVPENQVEGRGRLVARLDREQLPADLALTLVYDETPDADFVVQLWDAQDGVVAVDLFSNIITAGREAQTDTFIISLAEHPTATQVVLRRLKGEVRVYGLLLAPVACEVPTTNCDEQELAIQLGDRLSPEHPLVKEANRIAQAQQKQVEWETSEVQKPVPLAEAVQVGAAELTAKGYPVFVPSAKPVVGQLFFVTTGSAFYTVARAGRELNLYHAGALVETPGMMTSEDAKEYLFSGAAPACVMSRPMSVGERERFYRERGYHVIEAPLAVDAVQLRVNENCPLEALTIPQLDAIYGTELRAGAPALIRTWGDLGLDGAWSEQPIEVWGGPPKGGTAWVFRRLVLQNGAARSDIRNDTRLGFSGGMLAIASNQYAMAYANLQHRYPGTKQVALARQSGQPAYLPEAKAIYANQYPLTRYLYLYVDAASPDELDPVLRELFNLLFSREGQTLFAEVGQMPLGADQVRHARSVLGLASPPPTP